MRFGISVILFSCILGSLSGCQTDGPEPTSGAITGSVFPARGGDYAYLASGSDTIKMKLSSSGTYELSEITPKRYQLGVKPKLGFEPKAPYPVIITAGRTMEASPFRLEPLPANGAFAVTLNNKTFNDSIDFVSATGTIISSTVGNNAVGFYTISITLPAITKPDTFNTATNPDLKMTVLFNNQTWIADNTQGKAALNVTAFDPVSKRGNATFSFEAVLPGDTTFKGENGILRFVKLKP